MAAHRYQIRYSVEPWGKPVPAADKGERPIPGVRMSNSKYGYADRLFLVSFVKNKDGNGSTALLLDSEDGPKLTREYLEEVKAQIDHYLDHHCEG